MGYTDLVFDLYGTLVDIHTEETREVWEKTAMFLGFYGAEYTGKTLQAAFQAALVEQQAQAGQSYECFPDIPMEGVFAGLLRSGGVTEDVAHLAKQACQLFRICSTEYIRLYPHVGQALARLREKGFRLWLLSNAQAVFTRGELKALGLDGAFDGVYLSSDFQCRKPDSRFFRALLEGEGLQPRHCLMIGNDRQTDIAGAQAVGMGTLYLHTNLTPEEQAPADPARHPGCCRGPHWEYEGADWLALPEILEGLC